MAQTPTTDSPTTATSPAVTRAAGVRVPTPDGRPTSRAQLNTAVPALLAKPKAGVCVRIAAIYRRLNDVMSGMYTGVRCGGTPHSHHSYKESDPGRQGDGTD